MCRRADLGQIRLYVQCHGPIWAESVYTLSATGQFGPIVRKQVSELNKHFVLFFFVKLTDAYLYFNFLVIIMTMFLKTKTSKRCLRMTFSKKIQ